MRCMKKLFCETKITWTLLLVYSVLTGVIVGLLNCVPALENTSFTAPAVTFEYWFVAAIFIISNCKRATEAMAKTFVFFLISQPLIYLVEVPFKAMGWELFGYYKYWAVITVLTIPGAWIAYQIKRDNVLSAVILSVATGFLAGTGIGAVKGLLTGFPYGLVTAVFCFAFSIILIQVILNKKTSRCFAYFFTVAFAVALFAVVSITGSQHSAGVMLEPEHQWTIAEADADAEISGSYLTVNSSKKGTYRIVVKNEAGETCKYEVTFGDNMTIREIE